MDRSDRSPGRVAVVMLMAGVTLLVSSAIAGSPPKGRFGVGDSIMLSAKPELRPLGYGVNASVGRQFGAGVWIVRHKAEDGTLPKRVIVHLGTNGTIDPGDCDRLVGYAGPKRRVFLVTIKVPRSLGGAEQRDAARVRERSRQGARDPLVVEEPTTTRSGSPTTATTSTPRAARSTCASSTEGR